MLIDTLTDTEREDFEERSALVWEGTFTREPMTVAEAERLALAMVIAARRLPLEDVRT